MHEQVKCITEEIGRGHFDIKQKKMENIIFCFDWQRESEAIPMECFQNDPRAEKISVLP